MNGNVTGERRSAGTVLPGARVHHGEELRHVAMPIGGVGAGQVALCGDGGLRQWQLFNQVNHQAFVPNSFFAIRVTSTEPPLNVIRLLQAREIADLPLTHTPLINDDFIPDAQRQLVQSFPGVERTTFSSAYPFATLRYEDEALPLDVELEAYSPFIPLDAESSGLPAAVFTFTLRNPSALDLQGCLAATLQNPVGWDGLTPIDGASCPLFGGNVNRVERRPERTTIVMENPSLAEDHPGAGQMALTASTGNARTYERWSTPVQFRRFMEGLNISRQFVGQDTVQQRSYRNVPGMVSGPSPAGTTWSGGLMTPFRLAPGETWTATFVMSWHFPNRYVNFDQFGKMRDYGHSRFWLGNAYAKRFSGAVDVADFYLANQARLESGSRFWAALLADSTLPPAVIETLAAQGSLVRSPTTFWTEDDAFFGFEGSLGVSTTMWNGDFGGSCPLNCSHVWNYELALSKLFPQLERSMRETEFNVTQAPEGYIPHRTLLPLYLKQLWAEPIGGPTRPALDGMLGAILKTYREVRQSGDRAWLHEFWPNVKRLTDYIIGHWDADGDGVLEGEQPNTYDISFFGPNIYIGALWLAALRAAEEMATLENDPAYATMLRSRFELGRDRYDKLLWNSDYYIQILDPSAPVEHQFGEGCLADQLFGQWWAHLLDLGYILPAAHVKTTLRSIITHNFKQDFTGFTHGFRVYADQKDAGLLVCTWPHGGRPAVPVRYCDEVWTGIEYQVAAHCIFEGMPDEGMRLLSAVRARYSGERRNPFNEIECGDHYSRAMAGWSLLEALTGFSYDGATGSLRFAPPASESDFCLPLITGDGWGDVRREQRGGEITTTFAARHGEFRFRTLMIPHQAASSVEATRGGRPIAFNQERGDGLLRLTFAEPIVIDSASSLAIVQR